MLSGILDVDRLIISYLPDKHIINICQGNKYFHRKVCNDTFFCNLVYQRYPETIKYKDWVKVRDWKNFYLSIIYYVDKLEKECKFNYNCEVKEYTNISPELEYLSRNWPSDYNYNKVRGLQSASALGNLTVVKYLIEQGADIHADNNAALRYATYNGHLPVVRFLVENKADIYDPVLRHACWGCHLPVIEFLVEHGADMHANNYESLRRASEGGHLPVVKYLVEHGANIYAESIFGDTALTLAADKGNSDIVEYLQSLM